MKKQKKYTRIHKSAKILGAVLMGVLVFSGSVLAMPIDKKSQYNPNEVMSVIQSSLPSDSSYIEQWNKEFASNYKEFDQKEYLDSFKAKDESDILVEPKNSD
jgi:hypothetical protein